MARGVGAGRSLRLTRCWRNRSNPEARSAPTIDAQDRQSGHERTDGDRQRQAKTALCNALARDAAGVPNTTKNRDAASSARRSAPPAGRARLAAGTFARHWHLCRTRSRCCACSMDRRRRHRPSVVANDRPDDRNARARHQSPSRSRRACACTRQASARRRGGWFRPGDDVAPRAHNSGPAGCACQVASQALRHAAPAGDLTDPTRPTRESMTRPARGRPAPA